MNAIYIMKLCTALIENNFSKIMFSSKYLTEKKNNRRLHIYCIILVLFVYCCAKTRNIIIMLEHYHLNSNNYHLHEKLFDKLNPGMVFFPILVSDLLTVYSER